MSDTEKREPVLWDCDQHREHLNHVTIDDAVECHLDDAAWVPPVLTVCGFARMAVRLSEGSALEHLLEILDETHADPDGDYTTATERMKEAEAAFLKVVLEEYESWACEKVCEESVDVRAWLKENKPDWEGEVEIREPEPPAEKEST